MILLWNIGCNGCIIVIQPDFVQEFISSTILGRIKQNKATLRHIQQKINEKTGIFYNIKYLARKMRGFNLTPKTGTRVQGNKSSKETIRNWQYYTFTLVKKLDKQKHVMVTIDETFCINRSSDTKL